VTRKRVARAILVAVISLLGAIGLIEVTDDDICSALNELNLAEDNDPYCTHGPDEQEPLFIQTAPRDGTVPKASCAGSDASKVVTAVYGSPNDRERSWPRPKAIRRVVRQTIDRADADFSDATSGYHFNWECSAEGRPKVLIVELGGVVDTQYSFNDWVSDARTFLDLQDPNHIYSLFYDDGVQPFKNIKDTFSASGQATIDPDSSEGVTNPNNTGPAYSLTSAIFDNALPPNQFGWWYNTFSEHTLIHEITHNMGGVQLDAPDADGGWHCTDSEDFMCYVRILETPCPDLTQFDCSKDSYFNPTPSPRSYLDTHHNIAESPWLHKV
jgi:hypothetical protein